MGSAVSEDTTTSTRTYVRRAHHAGSWYSADKSRLREQLEGFLTQAAAASATPSLSHSSLRALIVPHAGYAYSGPTAAFAYHALRQELTAAKIRQILVLHPSHHVYLPNHCRVSNASVLSTPLGDLRVDTALRQELMETAGCSVMTRQEDEQEHSGEMQYPYLALLLEQQQAITVTPVMCGSLRNTNEEERWGNSLSDIMSRPGVLTIVSTDFCHWGERFEYRPTGGTVSSSKPIYKYIQELDRRGMDAIQSQQPGAFATYLKETSNTICGRYAVAVWMRGMASKEHMTVDFVRYDQSSQVQSMNDSSVSYAAATARESETP